MNRQRVIAVALLASLLAQGSGLAMRLHVAWEHGPADVSGTELASGASVCRHGHGHQRQGQQQWQWGQQQQQHGHAERAGDARSEDCSGGGPFKRPMAPGEPGEDCVTCVWLGTWAATPTMALAASAWFEPLIGRLPVAGMSSSSSGDGFVHFSRGPPVGLFQERFGISE